MPVLYTISMNIKDRACVVVGGGKVAERKTLSLLEAGAVVLVVSPQLTATLKLLESQQKIKVIKRNFIKTDVNNALLVISATDCDKINKEVAAICKEKDILVNIADNPIDSTFHVPSVLRRGDLSITVSTNGKSPALAAKIKKDLSKQYGDEYIEYIELLGELRQKILSEVEDSDRRKKIFQDIVESDLLELIQLGKDSLIRERINKCLS